MLNIGLKMDFCVWFSEPRRMIPTSSSSNGTPPMKQPTSERNPTFQCETWWINWINTWKSWGFDQRLSSSTYHGTLLVCKTGKVRFRKWRSPIFHIASLTTGYKKKPSTKWIVASFLWNVPFSGSFFAHKGPGWPVSSPGRSPPTGFPDINRWIQIPGGAWKVQSWRMLEKQNISTYQ